MTSIATIFDMLSTMYCLLMASVMSKSSKQISRKTVLGSESFIYQTSKHYLLYMGTTDIQNVLRHILAALQVQSQLKDVSAQAQSLKANISTLQSIVKCSSENPDAVVQAAVELVSLQQRRQESLTADLQIVASRMQTVRDEYGEFAMRCMLSELVDLQHKPTSE